MITTGSWPEVVAIADFNNDGLNDVAIGTSMYSDPSRDFKLLIFYQDTSGNLSSPALYPYPIATNPINSIATGDLNNDQLIDIVIGYNDSIGIFYQNNSGTLNPMVSYHSGRNVDGVKIGDLNNDGLNDIAVCHWTDPFIRIFYEVLTGFTTTTYPKQQGGYDEIDIGDLNDDGLNDLVYMSGQILSGIHIYKQSATGGLGNAINYCPVSNGYSLNGFGIGDLNNDGRNDIAASKSGNNPNCKMFLLTQDSLSGLMNGPDTLLSYDIPESVEIADLNCDGRNEIITLNGGWLKASVYEQDTANEYNSFKLFSIPYASHYKPQGLSIGDINNDGRKDIAIADYNNGLVLLYNTTMPQNFSVVDTLMHITTVNTTVSNTSYYFKTITVIDDKSSCMVRQVDSFSVTQSYENNKLRIDSLYIKGGSICSYQFSDTIVISHFQTETILLSSDTSYLSTSIDTVFSDPITNFTLEKMTSLYPVPTNEIITLALTNPCYTFYRNTEALIEIYNDKGAHVFSGNVFTNDFPIKINLSNYSCGIYFLRCTSTDNSFTKKIIKVN